MNNYIKAGTFQFKENWTIKTVDKETGKILSSEEVHNAIVNDGLERVARLIMGDSSTYFRAIAIGVGTTAVTNSDTALETENSRAAATLSYVASYKAQFTYEFTFGGSYAITEAGIFDSVTPSGSTMLSRLVFAAKNVSTTVNLIATATITVSRV
jgi:hypothetical protein